MVSPLSARLLSLSAIANISSRGQSATSSSVCSSTSNDSGDSGSGSCTGRKRQTYSERQNSLEARSNASSEDGSGNIENSVSSYKRVKRTFDVENSSKAEAQYVAATAKSVLESAGMPSQLALGGARSGRVLPLGSVDMSTIKLQSSGQARGSAALPLAAKGRTKNSHECDAQAYSDMINFSRDLYRFPSAKMSVPGLKKSRRNSSSSKALKAIVPSEDESLTASDENSNSASSDTDSDDSQEQSIALGIPARLEDAIRVHRGPTMTINQDDYDRNSTTGNAKEPKLLFKKPISGLMCLGEALMSCPTPRIVTQAKAPFLVVHVNAAYTRLTGVSSSDLLGKPLSQVFASTSQHPQGLCLVNCAEMSSTGREVYVRITTQLVRKQGKDASDEKRDTNSINDDRSVKPVDVTVKGSAVCKMDVLPIIPEDLKQISLKNEGETIDVDQVTHYSVEIVPFNILSPIKEGETKSQHNESICTELNYDLSTEKCKGRSRKELGVICKSVEKKGLVVMG